MQGSGQLIILLPLFALYFGVLRPRQKAMKLAQLANKNIEVGNTVMTTSGIHATVRAIDDTIASIEIAPGTVIRIERRAIAKVISVGTELPELASNPHSPDATPNTEASA
jgi:preprotein translocase subunit YajC